MRSTNITSLALAGALLGIAPTVQAAFEVQQIDVPISYSSATAQNDDFNVTGHNPALGTLQSISYQADAEYGSGTLN